MDVVALGIQRVAAIARNQVSVGRPQLRSVVLVQGRPGAEVVPAEICRDAIDVGSLLASCRTRLHYRVVNTDGLAFGIQLAKGALESCCAERRSDLFQPRCGIRKMFFDGISQCPRPPQKHPAVPEVIPCFEEFGSAARSEEHTSELQSRGHLVCRLL